MMYLTYRLHHPYVITEGLNNSDVFSINKNDYSCDYEIKTSKADLDREMKEVARARELICEEFPTFTGLGYIPKGNKLEKHFYYKSGKFHIKTKYSTYWIPNKFCFVIPESLFVYLSLKLVDLPYGIMTWKDDGDYDYWTMEIRKQPDFLHKEKADAALKETMLNRAVNELIVLREKLYRFSA